MKEKERADFIKLRLKEMMRKVPAHINSASVGVVRDFKKWFVTTDKLLEGSRTTNAKLEAAYQQAEQLYR